MGIRFSMLTAKKRRGDVEKRTPDRTEKSRMKQDFRPLALTALLLAPLAAAEKPASAGKPNVVLIVCDDLNDFVGHLGGHPQARTPHMDALAKSGISFRRAYCQDPICAPSRASFFTGIYPFHSGDYTFKPWFEFPVFQNSRTLMEHFRANGYHVVGSGKLMHHHRASDWDGFPYKASLNLRGCHLGSIVAFDRMSAPGSTRR